MPDINSVSVTYHDERKREGYGPMKKAEATITATVNAGEDGAAVLDQIAYIATAKVRAMLTIEGAQPAPAVVQHVPPPPATAAREPEDWGASQAQPSPQAAPPATPKIRRNADEIARGLTVEQALAERAARAGGSPPPSAAPAPGTGEAPTEAVAPAPSSDAGSAGNEWDGPAPVEISDEELNKHCSATAERIGDPIKVRNTKELYNPSPGQPFRVVEIPQDKRADFIEKLAAL